MPGQTDRIEALGRYVRRTAAAWLRQPNVTSMGVGVKSTGGQATGELCIQFTVGRKAGLEVLRELGLRELPRTLVVDGVAVEGTHILGDGQEVEFVKPSGTKG